LPSDERNPTGLRPWRLSWIALAVVGSGVVLGRYALIRDETASSPDRIPAYFESADAGRPFPGTLSPSLFEDPASVKSYELAREIPEVLAQQPCYCWCEGHGSLLGCHATRHADD
jgi:hypothetical protein